MPRPQLNTEIGNVGGPGGQIVTMGRRLYDLLLSIGRNPVTTVTAAVVGASPWVYTNDTNYDQDVIVAGGTVSAVDFGRAGVYYSSSGMNRLSPGDTLRVTYTVAPSVTIIPR